MSKTPPATQVLTANALLNGEPVWLDEQGNWTPHMAQARLLRQPEQAQQLLHWAERQQQAVVAPYLIEARDSSEGPQPTHFREDFRRRGPSNRRHGKQHQWATTEAEEREHVPVQ